MNHAHGVSCTGPVDPPRRLAISVVCDPALGYLHFFLVSYWVHDMKTVRAKVIAVGSIFAVDAVALVVFGAFLGWL
jgi:hypothetical protein